jgi:hypothetical protein
MNPHPANGAAPPRGAHEWVSFPDPEEDRTWLFDVTFLLSSWSCIFGCGCEGVLTGPAADMAQGCCSYGVHFTGPEDVARTEAAAATLPAELWQFARKGRTADGRVRVVRQTRKGDSVSRLVDGACIFLNRPGFTTGPGCALHAAALQRNQRPMDLKPEVCWQLPIRREDETDSTGHVTSTVRQWERRDWGNGGAEFHWWCTEAPEAFGGRDPVFVSLRDELVEIVGRRVYDLLAAELRRRRTDSPLPHPATAVAIGPARRRRSRSS